MLLLHGASFQSSLYIEHSLALAFTIVEAHYLKVTGHGNRLWYRSTVATDLVRTRSFSSRLKWRYNNKTSFNQFSFGYRYVRFNSSTHKLPSQLTRLP